MKKHLNLALASAVFFFVVGIGWGFWMNRLPHHHHSSGRELRVLCPGNWLSSQVLNKFSERHGVHIQLWTYAQPDEFLRQMANASGAVDVVCSSSFLVKDLIRNHWLGKADFLSLANAQGLSVDFSHLPYDPSAAYTVPLFWNLYGLFAKGDNQETSNWKQLWNSKKLTIWAGELNVMQLLTGLGVDFDQDMKSPAPKPVDEEAKHLLATLAGWLDPHGKLPSAEQMTEKGDVAEVPLSRVARELGPNSPYRFWLPQQGGPLEVGVLAIGSHAPERELALQLINALISDQGALDNYRQMEPGVVNLSLSHMSSVAPMQKAEAIREFPLTRFRFPDLNLESLPRFQKVYSELRPPTKSLAK